MAMTLAQKILQMHTDEEVREVGQIVECSLSGVLANDITGPLAIKSFRAMGAKKVFDKDKVFLVMDHYTPQKDIESANQVIISRNFAKEMGITHYYEGGCAGVEHALLPEKGLVKPGDLVIGADSHTCTYGGIGAFSTGLGSTDIACGINAGVDTCVVYTGEAQPEDLVNTPYPATYCFQDVTELLHAILKAEP